MAAGDSTLPAARTKAQYTAQNSKLTAEAWDAMLDVCSGTSNILAHLQGGPGSGKPFIVKQDLNKGRMETINMNVSAALGQSGRRGTERAVNYEEEPAHNNWQVQIDTLRVVVGWSEITRHAANTGATWQEAYAELCGIRVGQIEQEDTLMRFRQRSSSRNTIRPTNRATLDDIRYDDTIDAQVLGRGISLLGTLGGKPASLTKDSHGMDVRGYVALGADLGIEPLWSDTDFKDALHHAHVDGADNPLWTNKIPMYRNTAIKRWNLVDEDHPGAIGSTLMPKAILGDPIAAGTVTFTMTGGGRTQSSLGDSADLYKPFEYFYGCDKRFGQSISYGTDTGTYYFIVIDPADGKWNLYSYVQGGVNSNGKSITITKRLGPTSDTGARHTTIKADGFGGSGSTLYTYDATLNKEDFPTGSLIFQVNRRIVPVHDVILFGAEAGGKCYGKVKNQRIKHEDDYGNLQGRGVWSIYGSDLKKDTNGLYRGFVRVQCAYQIPGYSLPQI